jgi:hypothetical protein
MKSVGLWATRIGLMICVGIGTVELGQRVQAGGLQRRPVRS